MNEPEPKIIDVFICKLRKKLSVAGGADHIETVWVGAMYCEISVLCGTSPRPFDPHRETSISRLVEGMKLTVVSTTMSRDCTGLLRNPARPDFDPERSVATSDPGRFHHPTRGIPNVFRLVLAITP
jgi:hypothetical protein